MFISRRRRAGRDRFFPAKVVLLVVGGLVGAVGMTTGNAVLVNGAIVAVLVGFLLRFLPQARDPEQLDSAPDGEGPSDT
jgi:hypothetical protein